MTMKGRFTGMLATLFLIFGASVAYAGVPGSSHDKALSFAPEIPTATSKAPDTWYTDRYAPAIFESATAHGRTNVLRHGISADDCESTSCRPGGFHGPFYNTQGRKHDTPAVVRASIDLYIPADWANSGRRMAGFWGTAVDAEGNITGYPIVEFTSDNSSPRFQGWDSTEGWIDMGLPSDFQYDQWYTLSIELRGNAFVYAVDGELETIPGVLVNDDHRQLDNLILQGYNNVTGVTYDIHWDDLVTTRPVLNKDSNFVFADLQSAVDDAASGDTLQVTDATLRGNTTINKPLTLVSENGPAATVLEGIPLAAPGGTLTLAAGANNVTIGGVETGLTIIGSHDNLNPAQERGAIAFTAGVDGVQIIGNEIRAKGAHALYTASIAASNVLVEGNSFTGKTFLGEHPAGTGFGQQFTLANVPRQLVVFNPGASNVIFRNNDVSGSAGGLNEENNEQGNTLVTIDATNSIIEGNSFTGLTSRFATLLRARRAGTDIINNVFDNGAALDAGFLGSGGALFIADSFDGTISGNQFINNAGYALQSAVTGAIDARGNFWDAATGPLDIKTLPAVGGSAYNNVQGDGGIVQGNLRYWPWQVDNFGVLEPTTLVPVTPQIVSGDASIVGNPNGNTIYAEQFGAPIVIEFSRTPASVVQREFDPDTLAGADTSLAANRIVNDVDVSDFLKTVVRASFAEETEVDVNFTVTKSGSATSHVDVTPTSGTVTSGGSQQFTFAVGNRRFAGRLRITGVLRNGNPVSDPGTGCIGELARDAECTVTINQQDTVVTFVIGT
jgi:nitrous oxidase accessory protein NosD